MTPQEARAKRIANEVDPAAGGFFLRCLEKAALKGMESVADQSWRPIETAPKDGTLILLMVAADADSEASSMPTEDAMTYRTIGANNFSNDREDRWQFAGWCWSHDHWVEGRGTPVRWQPLPASPSEAEAKQ